MADLLGIAETVWQLRDVVSETDDYAAAQLHTIYNQLIELAAA